MCFVLVFLCVVVGEKFAMKIIEKKKFALNHSSKRPNALMVREREPERERGGGKMGDGRWLRITPHAQQQQ
jgi:hypothetical protein